MQGELDFEEFTGAMCALETHNFTNSELEEVFNMLDDDDSGTISIAEFSQVQGPEGLVAGAARTGAAVILQILTLAANAMTPIKFFKPKSNALEPFDMITMFRPDSGKLLLRLRSELKDHGSIPLLSGLTFPTVVNALVGTVSFTGYSTLLGEVQKRRTLQEQEEHLFVGVAAAGATAGFLQSFISCPAESLKAYMTMYAAANLSPPAPPPNPKIRWWTKIGMVLETYGGMSALYRPWGLLAARDSIGIATFFTCYETTKVASEPIIWSLVVHGLDVRPYLGWPQETPQKEVIVCDEKTHRWHEKITKYGSVLLAGGLAGLCYALVQHPFDVVKNEVLVMHHRNQYNQKMSALPLPRAAPGVVSAGVVEAVGVAGAVGTARAAGAAAGAASGAAAGAASGAAAGATAGATGGAAGISGAAGSVDVAASSARAAGAVAGAAGPAAGAGTGTGTTGTNAATTITSSKVEIATTKMSAEQTLTEYKRKGAQAKVERAMQRAKGLPTSANTPNKLSYYSAFCSALRREGFIRLFAGAGPSALAAFLPSAAGFAAFEAVKEGMGVQPSFSNDHELEVY
jgi:hypothetical protein